MNKLNRLDCIDKNAFFLNRSVYIINVVLKSGFNEKKCVFKHEI
jgi:hypothetical protein